MPDSTDIIFTWRSTDRWLHAAGETTTWLARPRHGGATGDESCRGTGLRPPVQGPASRRETQQHHDRFQRPSTPDGLSVSRGSSTPLASRHKSSLASWARPDTCHRSRSAGTTARSDRTATSTAWGLCFTSCCVANRRSSAPKSVLVTNTLHTEPPRPHGTDETIDLDLEAICLKTLAKKPSDRYASCNEFAEDLRRYQEGPPDKGPSAGIVRTLVRWCRRERALSSALGACLSLLLLFVVTLAVTVVVKIRSEGRVKAITVGSKRIWRSKPRNRSTKPRRSRDAARTSQHQAETSRAAAEKRPGSRQESGGDLFPPWTYVL